MNAELGVYLLLIAFVASVYASVASLLAQKNNDSALALSARNALLLTWPLLTGATLLLTLLLLNGAFGTEFVWSVTDTTMPTYLKATALWGGQAGSLLFWTWLLSSFLCGAVVINWKRENELMPIVINVSALTVGFFLLLVTFWENPFAQFWQTPSGDVVAALFGPSALLAGISRGLANLGEALPTMIGIIFGGIVDIAPPAGSFALNPGDGQGLNPLLRHPGMIIHPPLLYLGFVGFTVPFAFGVSALVNNRASEDNWMNTTRRWTLVAWLFLSFGLILGGWWAYDVLGWGGYWAWDPVENAAFLPWLTGTAFLHSVMIQEKRGMMRRWNVILVILTYLLVIFGTFATRSGFVSSVHSFAQSAIGPLFFVFLAGAVIASVAVVINKWDTLQADNELEHIVSRETAFLLNNVVFTAIALTVFVGTYWSVFTEILSGFTPVERSTLGPAYFNRSTGPMFVVLLFLMGVAPLIAWKKASIKRLGKAIVLPVAGTLVTVTVLGVLGVRQPGALIGLGMAIFAGLVTAFEIGRGAQARIRTHDENVVQAVWTLFGRNRRRYGGYLTHFGVVIIAIGIIASSAYQLETQQPLSAGQTITLGDYVLEYNTIERFIATDGRAVTRAVTTVFHNGNEIGQIIPRVDNYPNGQPMSIPGKLMSPLGDDFYVLLVSWEPVSMSSATFKVYYNPLVNWIWGGSLVLMLGTFVTAWPDTKPVKIRQPSRRTAPAAGD